MACYAPMHSGVRMRFGDLEQCLDAAVTGEWRGERAMSNGFRDGIEDSLNLRNTHE